MEKQKVMNKAGRVVNVFTNWDLLGESPPTSCAAPHTARCKPVARVSNGASMHEDLNYDCYVIVDDPSDIANWVLWCGDTGEGWDDERARLIPAAWIACGDLADPINEGEAAAMLIYAWIRANHQEFEKASATGGTLLSSEEASAVVRSALAGKALFPLDAF